MNEQTWGRIPEEMRNAPQWCIAGPDKAPYMSVDNNSRLVPASNKKPNNWKTFDEVAAVARMLQGAGVGMCLTYEDPWTCIDLDVCNEQTQRLKGEPIKPELWTSEETIQRYIKIIDAFDSYTEISMSGYGIHVWVRGRVGAGAKYGGVEVYSQERFMVCTGNVYRDKPIAERQELLEKLVDQMRQMQGRNDKSRIELLEVDAEDTDTEIFERAMNAENGEKFRALCEATPCQETANGKVHGSYTKLGYPTQSEADLALMSIFTFYSKSNEQCRRLFRCTSLGQREKAQKNDRYLNFTLEVIRGRQSREHAIDDNAREMALALVKELQGTNFSDVAAGQMVATAAAEKLPQDETGKTLEWPPGLAGALAHFIYNSAPRPVKEVAIVGALGFLAGVCGKAFNIPQSGLNAYIILVAKSAIGKEAMHSGLSHICNELFNAIPAAHNFVNFNEMVSGPALTKACSTNSSFVNVSGEFGKRLERMANEGRSDGPLASLRAVMTHLYQKSGENSQVGGMQYSDKDKNVATVTGVAYSLIGETTPGGLYSSLTQSMMEDGFLSRFLIVDYPGDRPARNKNQQLKMDPNLAQAMHGLCAHALNLISSFKTEYVKSSPEAEAALDKFDLHCDEQIRNSDDEAFRQMWNRAHLKCWRIAALLAAADNWLQPVISMTHYNWAHDLVMRDIKMMNSRMEKGDVGVDDSARDKKFLAVLRDYISTPIPAAYGCPEVLRLNGIVPRRYLQIRTNRLAQFMAHKMGSTQALDLTIRSCIQNGYITEVDSAKLVSEHSYHGKAYRVVNLPETSKVKDD